MKIKQESNNFQQSLNIETSPLLKVVLFDCGQNELSRLLILDFLHEISVLIFLSISVFLVNIIKDIIFKK